jgi:hypothetical protein
MNRNEEVSMPETGTKDQPINFSPSFVTGNMPNVVQYATSSNIKPAAMSKLIVIAYENGDGGLTPPEIIKKYGHLLRGSGHAVYDETVPPGFEKRVNLLMKEYNHPEFSRNNKAAFKNQFKKGLDLKMLTMTPN